MSTREEKFPSFILNINVSFHCQIKINKNTSNKLPLMEPKHTQIVQWKSEPNDFYGCGGKWVYVCVWQNTLECFFYSTQFFSVFWTTTENTCHTAPDTLSNCQNGRDRMSIAMLYKNDLNNFSVKIHLLSNWMKPYALHTMAVSSKFDAIHVHASRNYIEIEANKRRERAGKSAPTYALCKTHFTLSNIFIFIEMKLKTLSIPFHFSFRTFVEFAWSVENRGKKVTQKMFIHYRFGLLFWLVDMCLCIKSNYTCIVSIYLSCVYTFRNPSSGTLNTYDKYMWQQQNTRRRKKHQPNIQRKVNN